MKQIAVILFNYPDTLSLTKALDSLMLLEKHITNVYVLNASTTKAFQTRLSKSIIHWIEQKDALDKQIHRHIKPLTDQTILFLSHGTYLTARITDALLNMPDDQDVMTIDKVNKKETITYPLFVRQSFLIQNPLPDSRCLPFPDALLLVWLNAVRTKGKSVRNNTLKQYESFNTQNLLVKSHYLKQLQGLPTTNTKLEKMHAPTIAVMMATYNMADYLETSIASCFWQTVKTDDVFIIDDGSTDETPDILGEWKKQANIRVFHQKNMGKARALNYLIPKITTDFVLELDADDWLDPVAIQSLKKYACRLSPDVGLFYGNLRRWKQGNSLGDVMYRTTAHGFPVQSQSQLLRYPLPLGPRLYRTTKLKQVGGFPVSDYADGRLYEDVNLLAKLLKHTKLAYRDFTVYNVREHPKSITHVHHDKWLDFMKNWNQS